MKGGISSLFPIINLFENRGGVGKRGGEAIQPRPLNSLKGEKEWRRKPVSPSMSSLLLVCKE